MKEFGSGISLLSTEQYDHFFPDEVWGPIIRNSFPESKARFRFSLVSKLFYQLVNESIDSLDYITKSKYSVNNEILKRFVNLKSLSLNIVYPSSEMNNNGISS